ncbi:uncharacterized protein LOC121047824 [Ixodes scapularis]|uniref:uncharacterized protein LOC121047824 n=1 Tax=Ixodes scapularis TaxID=6945 RepID=UPI001AD6413C|nr:uncharacterized protein LOC121047824 [Ixodes scapularis]
MMTPNIPLLFTVQFLIVTTDSGFATYHSTTTITPAASAGAVLLRFLPITLGEDDRGAGATLQFLPAALTYTQVPPTSTSCARPSKAFTRDFSTSGHGEQAPMMTPNIPLLFTVQVGVHKIPYSIRSNNVCLVVLPCPRTCLKRFRDLLLLLSGDVERNPGPMSKPEAESLANIESIVSQLHAGQSSIMSQLKELNDEQKRTNDSISALTARVGIIESDLVICKSKMNSAEELEQKLESVLLEMASLKRRSDDAESRSRRSNLIFFGFKDTTKETWAESEKLVLDLCSDKLGLQIDPATIDRAHRIGRFNPAKNRPVVVKFSQFKLKDAVLGSAFKLKDTGISVSEDYPQNVQFARKSLLDFARTQGNRFHLRVDKLYIGEKQFLFDYETSQIYEAPT